ncbi:MAG: ATP-binding protein [Planctomycetota bacterium]|jgi:signal transduction histidine kinase|nr:ATP-binding protein [Planctomycetota bacterium]MDP7254378.1 ATP-binding protein [Planctomycetota bacterium]
MPLADVEEEKLQTIDLGEISLDADGRIQACSRGIERMFGVLHQDVIGKHCDWLLRGEDASESVLDILREDSTFTTLDRQLGSFNGRWMRCLLHVRRSDEDSPSFEILVREVGDELLDERDDSFHQQQVRELTRFEDLVMHTLREPVTRKQAIEVSLDNCLELLPCDLAVVALIQKDDAESFAITRVEPAEGCLDSIRDRLEEDLESFAQRRVSILPFTVIQGPKKREKVSSSQTLKSALSMPVFSAGRLAGLLAAGSRVEGAFSIKEERILSTLSTHLSLSLQQAHYQDSLRSTISELENLNRTLARLQTATEQINAALDAEELYRLTLSLAMSETDADSGSVILLNRESKKLEVAASRGLDAEMLEPDTLNRTDGIAKWVIETGRMLSLGPNLVHTQFQSPGMERGITHALVVPLRSHEQTLGAITVNKMRSEEGFTEVQTEALLMIGNAAAVALDVLRLYQEQIEGERIASIGMTVMGIGHYIKNLNTVLQVGRKLIDDGLRKGNLESVGAAWDTMRRSTDKLTNLAMDLLDYAKPREPIRQNVEIHQLLKNIAHEFEPAAAHHEIQIELSLVAEPSELSIDKDQIHRCVLNLMNNAIDAMPGGGQMILATKIMNRHNERAFLELSVSDQGEGIPDEVLPRIFQPMFSTKSSRGTGIGLAVTRKIIEEHGGKVELTTQPGTGTTFTLLLPLEKPDDED